MVVVSSTATVFIDEVEVTDVSLEGSSTRRLNRPSVAQVKLPMQHAIGGVGSLLKVYFDGVLSFHGRVLLCETDAGEDSGYTVYNATDPLELWKWRPVRDPGTGFTSTCGKTQPIDDPGDFSKPDIITDFVTGTEIVEAMMYSTQNIANVGSDDAEGPLFLQTGSFACGGVNLTGAPTDWPMTMAQLATLLCGTGELDIIVTPIELTDSGFTCGDDIVYDHARLDAYNGDYGLDLSTSVAFQYAMGLKNVRGLRWNEDMTNMCNKLWYYLGPKCDDQHWPANITQTVTDAFWTVCGQDAGEMTKWADWHAGVGDCTGIDCGSASPPDSRWLYGVRMDIKVFDALGNVAPCTQLGTAEYCLHKKLWLIESWLRCQPQQLIHVTPTRDTEIGTFDIGDLVLVEADPVVRGGFSGVQRVYEYTTSWDTDSVLALSELQVSSDNAGFDS